MNVHKTQTATSPRPVTGSTQGAQRWFSLIPIVKGVWLNNFEAGYAMYTFQQDTKCVDERVIVLKVVCTDVFFETDNGEALTTPYAFRIAEASL